MLKIAYLLETLYSPTKEEGDILFWCGSLDCFPNKCQFSYNKNEMLKIAYLLETLYSPTKGEGGHIVLVWIPVSFSMYKISHELVGRLKPNFH